MVLERPGREPETLVSFDQYRYSVCGPGAVRPWLPVPASVVAWFSFPLTILFLVFVVVAGDGFC